MHQISSYEEAAGLISEIEKSAAPGVGDWIKNNPDLVTGLLGALGLGVGGSMGGAGGGLLGAGLLGALGHYAPELMGYGEKGNLFGLTDYLGGLFGGGAEKATKPVQSDFSLDTTEKPKMTENPADFSLDTTEKPKMTENPEDFYSKPKPTIPVAAPDTMSYEQMLGKMNKPERKPGEGTDRHEKEP